MQQLKWNDRFKQLHVLLSKRMCVTLTILRELMWGKFPIKLRWTVDDAPRRYGLFVYFCTLHSPIICGSLVCEYISKISPLRVITISFFFFFVHGLASIACRQLTGDCTIRDFYYVRFMRRKLETDVGIICQQIVANVTFVREARAS